MTLHPQPARSGRFSSRRTLFFLLIILLTAACDGRAETVLRETEPERSATETQPQIVQTAPEATATNTLSPPTATFLPPPTVTPIPTTTPSATAVPTEPPTTTPTWTPTPVDLCSNRIPSDDDLLTLVTHEYGLGRAYTPGDLVPLSDYFPVNITLGYPTEVRAIVIEPLMALIEAMETAGLQPFIISGYRSYAAQSIAWAKWVEYNPDYAAGLSARPGHSEHQLGTTVDFGSPELEAVTGIEDIEFHTYFYMTSEGAWLLEHAHEYGFTMSYPPDTLDVTGFYYEPWHYRYVGVELATQLKAEETYLIAYLLENFPLPCVGE